MFPLCRVVYRAFPYNMVLPAYRVTGQAFMRFLLFSVPAGGYFLIRMTTTGTTGAALPTPDATASSWYCHERKQRACSLGKWYHAPGSLPFQRILYWFCRLWFFYLLRRKCSSSSFSSTLAAIRKNNGCTDTDNNGADFDVTTPAPRNSSSPAVTCGATPPELIATGTLCDFGSITIGSSSASQTYSLSGSFLTRAPEILPLQRLPILSFK